MIISHRSLLPLSAKSAKSSRVRSPLACSINSRRHRKPMIWSCWICSYMRGKTNFLTTKSLLRRIWRSFWNSFTRSNLQSCRLLKEYIFVGVVRWRSQRLTVVTDWSNGWISRFQSWTSAPKSKTSLPCLWNLINANQGVPIAMPPTLGVTMARAN